MSKLQKQQQLQQVMVRLTSSGYQWRNDQGEIISGSIDELKSFVGDNPVMLVLPGDRVTLHHLPYDAKQKKHQQAMAPFALEDALAEDPEELHFAFGEPEGDSLPVAVTAREEFESEVKALQEAAIDLVAVVPETLLLPLTGSHWTLLQEADRCMVRQSSTLGFAISLSLANSAINLALKEAGEEAPDTLMLFQTQGADELVLNADLVSKRGDFWSIAGNDCPINLLQGHFKRQWPWQQWLKYWRPAAAAALVGLVIQVAAGYSQVNKLQSENASLQARIETEFRKVIPSGRMQVPVNQLQRKVTELSGGGASQFVMLFAPVAEVIASQPSVSLQSVTFSDQPEEIRLTLLAPSFAAVESLRATLEKKQLKAEMTGTSNESQGTRARLTISRGQS